MSPADIIGCTVSPLNRLHAALPNEKAIKCSNLMNNTIHLKLPLLMEDRRGQCASFSTLPTLSPHELSVPRQAVAQDELIGCCGSFEREVILLYGKLCLIMITIEQSFLTPRMDCQMRPTELVFSCPLRTSTRTSGASLLEALFRKYPSRYHTFPWPICK